MRRAPVLFALSLIAFAQTPLERMEIRHLEATHAQRVQWMKQRVAWPAVGVYQDFRAILHAPAEDADQVLQAAKDSGVQVVMFTPEASHGMREGVLFISGSEEGLRSDGFPSEDHKEVYDYIQSAMKQPREWHRLVEKQKKFPDEMFDAANQILKGVTLDPYAVSFRNSSTHILARELTEADVSASLAAGHVYVSHDWLCDPHGFSFIAQNNLGVFDIGDAVPLTNNTRLEAHLPVPAKIKLIHNGSVVLEVPDSKIDFPVKEEGAYRLEAWLTVDGEDRPWIYSNPIYVRKTPGLTLPSIEPAPNVEVRKDIEYTEGDAADAAKHKLDLYLPKDKKDFPVMVFIHGGSWRSGDRSNYPALGYRFAKLGIGVAVPSYRLMPKNPHPAQIDDVAAAFNWVYKNIGQLGGDTKRIYLAGHSAGGHLVALLALDGEYLKKYDVPGDAIRGVAALSGVYDVSSAAVFRSDHDASPIHYVHPHAPPFLITYCQWDYPALPRQARDFAAALKKEFDDVQLRYVPGENHITEIIDIVKDDDPTARAILDFIK